MIRKVFKKLPSDRFHSFLTKYKINLDYFTVSRRFVSKAVLIGLFIALLPIPLKLLIVTLMTALIRFNIVIALSIVLFINPLIMPFIIYAEYELGSFLIGQDMGVHILLSMEWIKDNYTIIILPLITGALILAAALSLLSYLVVEILWIRSAKRAYKSRKILS